MARFLLLCLLLMTVVLTSQASSLGRSTDVDGECLVPPESVFYEDDQYARPCERLGASIARVIDIYRSHTDQESPETWDEYRQQFMTTIGVDIEDENQIIEYACHFEDVQTVDDVIERANLTEYGVYVKPGYQSLQLNLARIDGFHGFTKGFQLLLESKDALRRLTGKGPYDRLDWQEVRRVLNADNLAEILEDLEDTYGSGYLIYFLMRPYNDALVGVDHHLLAQAILDEDIACKLGVSDEIEIEFGYMTRVVLFLTLTPDLMYQYFQMYVAADQMGLLSLS